MSGQIHYEVFSRKTPQSGWALQMAVEDREAAISAAQDMLKTSHAAAVKVTKEVFADGEFRSYVLLTEGAPETKSKAKIAPLTDSVCTAPQDFYTKHAREKISRVLEDWLKRQGVTAFELLHRPDLAEKLDASSNELTHAIQKIAVPEAQETAASVHELMRRWSTLVDKAIARVVADGRRKLFPDFDLSRDIRPQIAKIAAQPERSYVLGGAVAKLMAAERSPARKLSHLTALIKAVTDLPPGDGPDLGWAREVIEVPVAELFAKRNGLGDLMGQEVDPGQGMAVLARLVVGDAVEKIGTIDSHILSVLPPTPAHLNAFGDLIRQGHFRDLRSQSVRNMLSELRGVKRLKPGDPMAEIDLLRALAMALTAGCGEEHERDEIGNAFIERSKMLVSSAFIESLQEGVDDVIEGIERLLWLGENVAGPVNKKQAARWLMSSLTAQKFERDLRDPKRPAGQKLAQLAALQKRVVKAQLGEKDTEDAVARLGHVGHLIAQDVHLIAHIVKGAKSPMQRVMALLSFATAQAGPDGALAEEAKAEVMKQLRSPEVRTSLMSDPGALANLRPLLVRAGLAA
ncbi:hypothetical protein [Asticcacaulis sp. YBE204]|uniref:hypothetical protein n=1 Tax=Asticcacaulis sp. YBE204 TaxID=1282363 RepID=UPI0003C3AD5B|nr:hypothetical protein [Asticcacaulis sp. YBE204]ESQ78538.1 hypothetical protein AEYBE204_13390 [Asticcacaulis sp. YBE204]